MEAERPQLRPDLEVLLDQPEGVLIYDPARRSLFELDRADLAALGLLDGRRTPGEIARQAGRPLDRVHDLLDDLADLMLLADPEQEGLLADWRREHEADDRLLAPLLESQPAGQAAGRPIHVVDDARHTCRRCGACCHYAVPVSPQERRRLKQARWPRKALPAAGRLFRLHPGPQWGRLEETIATRRRPTRCIFLGRDNLCRVQQALGPAAKPFPCRLFPLAYPVLTPHGVLFSLTFECPFVYETYDSAERLADRVEELAALAAEMEEVYILPASIPLDGEQTLPIAGYLAWEQALLNLPAAPATDPGGFLERLRRHWAGANPAGLSPLPPPEDLATLAAALVQAAREERATLVDCPEGAAGADRAVEVLVALSARPEQAWAEVPWEDGAAADRFLQRFVRHFVEGKQMLLYQPLGMGLRALAVLLLLTRADAALMAAGPVSLRALNRALARWQRLLDIRALRLAFLKRAAVSVQPLPRQVPDS